MDKKDEKKKTEEIVGKTFDDLSEEELKEVQGQGDVNPQTVGSLWEFLTSKGEYKCR
ncbi:type 2 lantibiotic, SP_1948 family [Pilibacter termitis]|uniref:Type 2 lantibiotic, SP_1948 family n=1 Tax=Pilibacter termitis TaxID=263852 RepID=A0A1T4KG91_9ENTE|nr:lichenicidin A2 family type 2 lantibiotic [Pilibacter termitis]SJZ41396.1 type 2 lantibiotic, SP_1948 family [Pilibacter termitis]